MNPLEFLEVAKKLKDSLNESDRRTSVSRSYYSVFNYIRTYLEENSIPIPTFAGHEVLIQYLKHSGMSKGKMLGQMVEDLRTERNKADYDMKTQRFNNKTCHFAF